VLPADCYAVRDATDADAGPLAELAALDGQPPLSGPALIAEVGGLPTAAISLRDGRVIADCYQDCDELAAILRAHATG
jgi:hypothetical protein